jgi:hypothetical protein
MQKITAISCFLQKINISSNKTSKTIQKFRCTLTNLNTADEVTRIDGTDIRLKMSRIRNPGRNHCGRGGRVVTPILAHLKLLGETLHVLLQLLSQLLQLYVPDGQIIHGPLLFRKAVLWIRLSILRLILDPDRIRIWSPTPSFTHVGKSRIIFFLLPLTAVQVYIVLSFSSAS